MSAVDMINSPRSGLILAHEQMQSSPSLRRPRLCLLLNEHRDVFKPPGVQAQRSKVGTDSPQSVSH
ncbi:hypothetical protein EYF80_032815 [Liparis tanakae]|uniref:Uncharacterized protein n=1 Tax=Liparis tanakae TaxID=230148 RepID=A0A4Z2GWQ2_9TELE|nr:hypothetical protein EYF80_032815 [Liparis tanakae]